MEPSLVTNLQIAEQESRGQTPPIAGESSGVNIDSVVDDVSSIASNLEFDTIRDIEPVTPEAEAVQNLIFCSSSTNSQVWTRVFEKAGEMNWHVGFYESCAEGAGLTGNSFHDKPNYETENGRWSFL